MNYRAFNAIKSMSYGNSKTLSVGYDNRLQPSSYEVSGILKRSYQRNNDGNLQFTQDQLTTNSKFDRSYSYDHLGRVTLALSGAEARGGGATDDRPYNESFTYNAMGQMTARQTIQWNQHDGSTDNYVNNRHEGWWYDADGRLTSGSTGAYVYDAAGSITSFGDSSPNMTDQQMDGDGRRVKATPRSYNDQTNQWTTGSATYYVDSTVLGGQPLTEVSSTGAKQTTYVYAGSNVLAEQSVQGGQQYVYWRHEDASGGSFRKTNSAGESIEAAELDPLGANAGLYQPLVWPPPPSTGELVPFRTFDDMNAPGGGCEVDRVPMPCGMATMGSSVACPNGECSRYNPNLRNGHGGMEDFHSYADGYSGYLSSDERYRGDGQVLYLRSESFGSLERNHASELPQNSGLTPFKGKTLRKYDKQRDIVRASLTNSDSCRQFLTEHGIDPTAALDAVNQQQAYNGPKSTMSRLQAGTVDLSDPDFQSMQLNDPTRAAGILNGPVSGDFRSAGRMAETAFYPGGVFGATPADRSTVFFRKNGLTSGNILHEALHSLTGLNDELLARQLGVEIPSSGVTDIITQTLVQHGCGVKRKR